MKDTDLELEEVVNWEVFPSMQQMVLGKVAAAGAPSDREAVRVIPPPDLERAVFLPSAHASDTALRAVMLQKGKKLTCTFSSAAAASPRCVHGGPHHRAGTEKAP